ncbi:hypothetical protein WJX84_004704 [Apatococcus fuscideae]|uniref:Uncharacterized protein n=1 Tax=Apatococcus fuscideae TaxID=2026836 RepID=A0AAW1TBG9_9CHLO
MPPNFSRRLDISIHRNQDATPEAEGIVGRTMSTLISGARLDGDLTDAVEVFDLGSRAMHSDTLEARLIGEYRTSDLFANDAQLTRFNPASTQQIDAADLALTIGPISLLSDSQPAQALPSASHRRLRL